MTSIKIPLDKQAHALGGAVIVLASAIAGHSLMWAILVCALAALAKEVYDAFHPATHTKDAWDFVATVVGGLMALAFIAGVKLWM